MAACSVEQAQFDINSLFDMMRKRYGLYDFYGGAEVFEAARQQALEDCESAQTLDADALQQIILDNLSFITDQHFLVGGKHPVEQISIPTFLRKLHSRKPRMATVRRMVSWSNRWMDRTIWTSCSSAL